MATTLSSPGVEVREIDASLRVSANGGTTVFIPGFASQGPVEEVTSIGSITDFEQMFGVPTNAAERYFYYTVLAVLNNASASTTILVSRLPYGYGEGDTVSSAFTLLAYPAAVVKATVKTTYDKDTTVVKSADKRYSKWDTFAIGDDPIDKDHKWGKWSVKNAQGDLVVTDKNLTYIVGEPTSFQMSLGDYYDLLTDVLFTKDGLSGWSNTPGPVDKWEDLRNAAFIVINKSRSIINESLEGFYFGLNDNMFNEPGNYNSESKEYDNIKSIKFSNTFVEGNDHAACSDTDYQYINENKLDFELQGSNQGSLSRVIQKDTSSYTNDKADLDDVLACGLFKLTKSTNGAKALKLVYELKESYNFSLGSGRETSSVQTTKPVTLYGPNVMKNSNNVVITVNPFISKTIKTDINGDVIGRVRIANDKLLNKLAIVDNSEEWNSGKKLNEANNRSIITRAGIDYSNLAGILGLDNCAPNYGINYIRKCQSLYSFGTYTLDKKANAFIGSVPSKLTRALTLIDNDEEWPDVDIVCEAGLGTVYAYSKAPIEQITSGKDNIVELWKITLESDPEHEPELPQVEIERAIDYNAGDITPVEGQKIKYEGNDRTIYKCEILSRNFVDSIVIEGLEDLRSGKSNLNDAASVIKQYYMAVQNVFLGFANTFANGGRGDVFYLPDILRGILVKGVDTKVENTYGTQLINNVYSEEDKVNNSWSTSIYYPIKHLYEDFTSSFAAVYAQMFKIEDTYSNKFVWMPASGYVAAAMCAADTLAGPWLAGAGLNRGIVQGVLDVAVNPVLRQRDDLYKISINAIPKMANVGAVIYGIRTMIKKPTSFDQVTCRRTALLLGKTMKRYLRYYVFEPNTSYTRLAMYNDLQPYLESIKAAGGIYNYRLVTNESINTPEIINNGEMAVACAVQYVRTAEFVTLTMTAEKYSTTVDIVES